MNWEKNLEIILKTLSPQLHNWKYIFLVNDKNYHIKKEEIIMSFQEEEWETLIINQEAADILNISYQQTFGWITLNVHSNLESIWLTAIFSTALAENNISCNVIAGYYHDHIFIPDTQKEKALKILHTLSK